MRWRPWRSGSVLALWFSLGAALHAAAAQDSIPLAERGERLLERLQAGQLVVAEDGQQLSLPDLDLHIRQCGGYPYAEHRSTVAAAATLLADLRSGLATGMQCLSGDGPMGRLHPYHRYQANRLLELLESNRPKTFQCVEDAMFATAVATGPQPVGPDDPLYEQLRKVQHPAVVLDTYRLGGFLSRQYDDETYRTFFHLREEQIVEHRSGQPLQPASLHRYRDRAGLLFHEMVHWLGHEHSAIYPDVTHLYETCCFAGSDYISDAGRNRTHQQTACAILRDDELWSQSYTPYKQMRLWHHKGYDRFKSVMREDFDS